MRDVIIPSSLAHFISSLSPLCPCLMSAPDWPLKSLWDLRELTAHSQTLRSARSACFGQFEQVEHLQWAISLGTKIPSYGGELSPWPASPGRLKVAKTRMMGQWQQLSPSVVHAPLIPGLLQAPAYWSNETIRWPDNTNTTLEQETNSNMLIKV